MADAYLKHKNYAQEAIGRMLSTVEVTVGRWA